VSEALSLGGTLNTNDYPYLEFQAPKAFFMDLLATLHLRFDERNRTMRNTDLVVADYLDGREPTVEERANLVRYLETGGGTLPRLYPSSAAGWWYAAPDDPAALEAAIRAGATPHLDRLESAAALAAMRPEDMRLRALHAEAALDAYDILRTAAWDAGPLARTLLDLLPTLADEVDRNEVWYRYKLGQVLYDSGRYEEAVEQIYQARDLLGLAAQPTELFRALERAPQEMWDQIIPRTDPRTPPDQVLTFLGRALVDSGRGEEAREAFRDAYRLNPQNAIAAFWIVELDEDLTSGRFLDALGPPRL
jgi:tetratricopeptide (TPR) repeat protein